MGHRLGEVGRAWLASVMRTPLVSAPTISSLPIAAGSSNKYAGNVGPGQDGADVEDSGNSGHSVKGGQVVRLSEKDLDDVSKVLEFQILCCKSKMDFLPTYFVVLSLFQYCISCHSIRHFLHVKLLTFRHDSRK